MHRDQMIIVGTVKKVVQTFDVQSVHGISMKCVRKTSLMPIGFALNAKRKTVTSSEFHLWSVQFIDTNTV